MSGKALATGLVVGNSFDAAMHSRAPVANAIPLSDVGFVLREIEVRALLAGL